MTTAILALLLASPSAAQAVSTPAASSFPVEQPETPVALALPGEIVPMFGQTPPLRFVYYVDGGLPFDPADRAAILREIRLLRDFYRHYGLFLPVEERVFEARGAAGARSYAAVKARLKELKLWAPGRTVVFAAFDAGMGGGGDMALTGINSSAVRARECAGAHPRAWWCSHPESEHWGGALHEVGHMFGLQHPKERAAAAADAPRTVMREHFLFGSDPRVGLLPAEVDLLKKKFAFAPPPPTAVDRYYTPAKKDYRITPEDLRTFERGLADVRKVAPKIYPDFMDLVDAILYDTSGLYVYSHNDAFPPPFTKVKRWRGYQVYYLAQHPRPAEHEMAGCATGGRSFLTSDIRAPLGELFIACAPWGTFGRIQKKRGTVYRFVEGYWDSIIHEYGHAYQEHMAGDPTPEMAAVEEKIEAMKLDDSDRAASATREGYANLCQLKGAKMLYPDLYKRMTAELKTVRRDDAYGHETGMDAAAAVLADEDKAGL